MTDTSPAAKPKGECVFCGAITTFAGHASTPFRPGEPDAEGKIPLIPKPPVWMCENDLRRYTSKQIYLGWCESCARWGEAGTGSPCGALFSRL
jgi:hypothetical protein